MNLNAPISEGLPPSPPFHSSHNSLLRCPRQAPDLGLLTFLFNRRPHRCSAREFHTTPFPRPISGHSALQLPPNTLPLASVGVNLFWPPHPIAALVAFLLFHQLCSLALSHGYNRLDPMITWQ
eukprot:GGOE01063147.1.p2 GENE.GGOE01063147.1~~GGOE01063147.1.p2  ORF type:complete len:123 (-),score=5.62 GGOE01063147.1:16-384(-)